MSARLGPYDLNTIVVGDCLDVMRQMPDGCVDLVVTSPPYDKLREYGGYHIFDFRLIAHELLRVTKIGGVTVWVIGDATINGSETGTSFRQALGFMGLGFRLHDTMIYQKINPTPYCHNRYQPAFEYMFVFSKDTPKTFNAITVKSKHGGLNRPQRKYPGRNGPFPKTGKADAIKERKLKHNIWPYKVGIDGRGRRKHIHPAPFPEALAHDHIISWSNSNDLIFDPFMGSGTTAVVASRLGRNFFGCDINPDYVQMSLDRIA